MADTKSTVPGSIMSNMFGAIGAKNNSSLSSLSDEELKKGEKWALEKRNATNKSDTTWYQAYSQLYKNIQSEKKNRSVSPTDDKRIYDYKYQYPRADIEYFKKTIVPIMTKLRPKYTSDDAYFDAIVKELNAKGRGLNANTINMIVDRMAIDRIPKNAWDYITTQAGENFDYKVIADVIKSTKDLVKGKDDSPLEAEIKDRARAFYNPSVLESLGAISATSAINIVTQLPMVIATGGGWAQGNVISSTAMEVEDRASANETHDLEHRNEFAIELATYYNEKQKKHETNVPSWMLKQGLHGKTYETASDKELQAARDWAKKQTDIWLKRYNMVKDRTPDENGYTFRDSQSGKLYTTTEVLRKHQEYQRFHLECAEVINSRKSEREMQKVEAERQQAEQAKTMAEANGRKVTLDNIDEIMYGDGNSNNTSSTGDNGQQNLEADPWGLALSSWKKNSGLEEFLKHPGSTLASIPDVLMGMFTGKTEFKSDMLMPLACMISGFFTSSSLLKVPLIMGGAASIAGKVANGGNTNQSQQEIKNNEPRYKQYKDVELDPRISNPQLNGNTLMLDIDHSPYVVAISSTAVDAYQKGSLPLNVIANSVLANLDQTRQASREQQQQIQQSLQNNEREQNIRIK